MNHLSPSERFREFHRRILLDEANAKRVASESEKFLEGYENAMKSYVLSLHQAFQCFWPIYTADKSICPTFELPPELTIAQIPIENDDTCICEIMNEIKSNINEEEIPSYKTLLKVLACFNFLWSKEAVDSFNSFLDQISEDKRNLICILFAVNPAIIQYFQDVFSPVFKRFYVISIEDAVKEILSNLSSNIPIFPDFAKKHLNSTILSKLINIFIDFYPLYGLGNPELQLYNQEKLTSLKTGLDEFMNSPDGEDLVQKLKDFHNSISIIPSEAVLVHVHPHCKFVTIWNGSFVPVSARIDSQIQQPISHIDSLIDSIKDILKVTRLLLIQTDDIMQYLEKLAELSMIGGEILLGPKLKRIAEFLEQSPMSFEQLCDAFEESLTEAESEAFLMSTSTYSYQNSTIKILTGIANDMVTNARNLQEFTSISAMFNSELESIELPSVESMIQDPQVFAQFFAPIADTLKMPQASSYRALFILAFHKFDLLNKFEAEEHNSNHNTEAQAYIEAHSQELAKSDWEFISSFPKDSPKLDRFYSDITLAFSGDSIFERCVHVHSSYQYLESLLTFMNVGEYGADQLLPFAMMALVYANPERMMSTAKFITEFINKPFAGKYSPLEPAEMYYMTQFNSSCAFIEKEMEDANAQPNKSNLVENQDAT